MIEVKLNGFDDIDRALKELPAKLHKNILDTAVRAGSNVVRDAARKAAPVGSGEHWVGVRGKRFKAKPGNLRKGIVSVRSRRKSAGGQIVYEVGPNKAAFYGLFIEKGYVPTGPRRKGMSNKAHRAAARNKAGVVSYVPPRPFLRPAFDGNTEAVINAMADKIRARIDTLYYGVYRSTGTFAEGFG